MTTYKLIISGKVQGVFFRASTKAKAQELGLAGFVENLSNGDVQAVIQGNATKCQTMVQWCQTGPSQARVEQVQVTEIADPDVFTHFSIHR